MLARQLHWPDMLSNDQRLTRHLTLAVLVKLCALAAIWWFFVRDARVPVDADLTAARFAMPAERSTPPQGNPK